MPQELETDILVIGGGIAALAAALEARKHGVQVCLVDKGRAGLSGSTPTSGGVPGFFVPPKLGGDPGDSEELFLNDIIQGGDYLGVQPLAEIFIQEGRYRLIELDEIGVPFQKSPDGKFKGRRTLGLSFLKVASLEPPNARWQCYGCGHQLTLPIVKEFASRGGTLLDNVMVSKLFLTGEKLTGALGVSTKDDRLFLLRAKGVVLAAGSATGLYLSHSANYLTTGDSYALAYHAGATLMNMEFQEFTVGPAPRGRAIATGGIKPTISGGALLYDGQGHRFMGRYDPARMEFARRSTLVQAVASENREGRGAFLDLSPLKDHTMLTRKLERIPGLDWRKEWIPLTAMIHGFLGGARADEFGRTDVQGLFACGEAAGFGGLFGADRVGGAIGACIVFGARAGRAAAQYAQSMTRFPALSRAQVQEEERKLARIKARGKKAEIKPHALEKKIRSLAEQHLSVIREEKELRKALSQLEQITELAQGPLAVALPQALIKALEVRNLALTAQLVGTASMARQESRGQLIRKDFPNRNDSRWLKWICLKKKDEGQLSLSTLAVPWEKYRIRPPQ